MAPSPTDIGAALQSIPEKKDYVRKVFGDLEEQRATIARCSGGWNDLDSHLTEIHEALEKRYAEIVDKETKFEARMLELQASLDKRESVIESREQASLARVQEQKDAAVAAIREQKRKWIEERQLIQSQSPAKPDPDSSSSKAKQKDNKVSAKDEAGAKSKAKPDAKDKDPTSGKEKDAVAKEKDDAGAKKNSKEDASAKKNPKEGSSSKAKKTTDNPSSTPQKNEESSKSEEEKKRKLEPEVETDKKQETEEQEEEEEEEEDVGDKQDSEIEDAKDCEDRPQAMDEDGAKSGDDSDDAKDEDDKDGSHKKEENVQPSVKVRPELTSLCENMNGPGLRLFLTSHKKDLNLIRKELPIAMKCASDPSQLVLKAIEGFYTSGLRSEGAQGKRLTNRRSCIAILESLAVVLAGREKDESAVSDNIKEEVKVIADKWKSKLNPKGTDQTALLDMQCFLQLIATFGLANEYDENELCDLVVPICTRKHVPALFRKLGLANKASDVVERLINDDKQLDAITYIEEYQLSEQFPLVPLIRTYLRDVRKGHLGKISPEDKDEFHMKELNAAKAVLKCVEKYKLEAVYPTDGLQRRIVQLERVNPDNKRSSDAAVGGSKKPRINGPGNPPNSGPFRSSDRPHFGGRGMGGRNYGSPYGQGRGARGGYPYPAGGAGYGGASYSHGNYQYGGGPPYQGGSYMR